MEMDTKMTPNASLGKITSYFQTSEHQIFPKFPQPSGPQQLDASEAGRTLALKEAIGAAGSLRGYGETQGAPKGPGFMMARYGWRSKNRGGVGKPPKSSICS